MDDKERFTFLSTSLRELYKMYMDILTKTLALLVVAIGWVVTSSDARNIIRSDQLVKWGSELVIALFLVAHSLSMWWYAVRLKRKMQLISNNNAGLNVEYYDEFLIGDRIFVFNWLLSFFLFVVLLLLVGRNS